MASKINPNEQLDSFYSNLDSKGRLVLPFELRKKAGFKTGDIFAISLDSDSVVQACNIRKKIRGLRGILKSTKKGKSIVNELIAERRKEGLHE